MVDQIAKKNLYLILAVAGNTFFVFLFLNALVSPLEHREFIRKTSLLLFVTEFLSIHSTGMIQGLKKGELLVNGRRMNPGSSKKISIFLMLLYAIFALGYGAAFDNWVIPTLFFVSVLSKYFGAKAGPEEERHLGVAAVLFLFTTFLVTILAQPIGRIFPFPAPVLKSGGGLFEGIPQTVLVWGVLYYGLIAVRELLASRKNFSNIGTANT